MSDQQITPEVLTELSRAYASEEQQATSDAAKILAEQKETIRQRAAMRAAIRESRTKLGLGGEQTDDDVLRTLEHTPDAKVNLNSQTVSIDGSAADLGDVLVSLWRRQRWSTEYRPMKAERDTRFNGVESKADLKTTKQKCDFVARFGESRYSALPATTVPKGDLLKLTPAELVKLPVSEKTKIVNRVGRANWERMISGKGLGE